jgi:hypothetical protein
MTQKRSLMRVCVKARCVAASHQIESTARAESLRALCYEIEGLNLRESEPDADADENQANDDQCYVDGQRERYPRRLLVHLSAPERCWAHGKPALCAGWWGRSHLPSFCADAGVKDDSLDLCRHQKQVGAGRRGRHSTKNFPRRGRPSLHVASPRNHAARSIRGQVCRSSCRKSYCNPSQASVPG